MARWYRGAVAVVVSIVSAAFLLAVLPWIGGNRGSDVSAAPEVKKEPTRAVAECRWADTPIVLDGSDADEAWKHAQVIDNFGRTWEKDPPALRGATKAKLLWDRDFLYFHAEMVDTDIFADVKEHDGAIWTNDTFELFFRPAVDKPGYYEFEVNAAEAVFDAFFPKVDIPAIIHHIKKGDFRIEVKAKLRGTLNRRDDKDAGWSVEGRIPWVDFLRTGGRPVAGESWAFNLCRCNYDKGLPDELSATAPIRERKLSAFFHQIDDYPLLTFVGPDARTRRPSAIERHVPVKSTVVGSPDPPPPYRVKRMYPNYEPTYPILAKAIPGTQQLIVISEDRPWGVTVVSRLKDDQNVSTKDAVKLLDTPGSGTIYDVEFHPDFVKNRYVYIGWNGKHDTGKVKKKASRVTRYTMSAGPEPTIEPASAVTIIEWESDGHNGAAIAFGKDGMLYVTSGDGTSDSDTDVMGQRPDGLLSKVLRIDVDHPADGKQYSVPKDNPFAGDERFAPETYAFGLRNPWRIAADRESGQIWVGNNGQDLWEQAYLVRPRDNYGWSVTEGSQPFYANRKTGPAPIVRPTIEHPHSEFRSLTGGFVWRGKQLPELDGAYLYGDYSTGRIWGMKHDGTKAEWHKELASPRLQITGFARNTRGELIISDHSPKGGLYTLEPTPKDDAPSTFPRRLSDSKLFASVKEHRMAEGVLPYSVVAPFWSDGLHKERFMALPSNEPIEVTKNRGWGFPDRTVLVKSFALETEEGRPESRRWVETRFMTKQAGEWFGYSYVWNEQGTDAELVGSAGLDKTFAVKTKDGVREQKWRYPSRMECMVCHSRAANFVLGLCTVQMNKVHDYGGKPEHQLAMLERLGLLKGLDWTVWAREQIADRAKSKKLTGKDADDYAKLHGPQPGQRTVPGSTMLTAHPQRLPHLVDPSDRKQELTLRAKSWLHSNCSSCHVEAGGGNAQMDLEFVTALEKMRIHDVKPVHSMFGLDDARLIASGSPERSVLLKRIQTRGRDQMPPLASYRMDEQGVALIREWIQSLPKAPDAPAVPEKSTPPK